METVQKNLISLEPVTLDDGKELFGNFILPDEKVCFTFKELREKRKSFFLFRFLK